MEQFELFPLQNPCIGVCVSNNRGYCKGCLRSRAERQQWLEMNNEKKRYVLRLCNARRKKINRMKRTKQHKETALPQQLDFDFLSGGE